MTNEVETAIAGQSIPVPCPHCGKETSKKVSWLKTNKNFTCSGCGGTVLPDTKKLFRDIAKADKIFKNAFRRRR